MKKFLILFSIILLNVQSCFAIERYKHYVIDAEKNAYHHNNLGVMYIEEKNYSGAIQEFKIAISLNPRTQATSTYFNNLGKVYMIIGYPELALDCFQNALTQYNLNFEYYQNLVDCFAKLGLVDKKIQEYKTKTTHSLDMITLALLFEKKGQYKKSILLLDEFVGLEPDLVITPSIKTHIQTIVDKVM